MALSIKRDGGKKVIAVGEDAKKMLGKTPGKHRCYQTLKDGVIADFNTEAMLKYFIQKIHNKKSYARPRIVHFFVPSESPRRKTGRKNRRSQQVHGRSSSSKEPMACCDDGLPHYRAMAI